MSDKRTAILDATLTLISERGFHNTPMSLIATTSGVSVGIIYHYFSGKEELINELYKEIKLEIIHAMLADYALDVPLSTRFMDVWTNYVSYSLSNPTKGTFLEQFENSPLIKHVMDDDIMQAVADSDTNVRAAEMEACDTTAKGRFVVEVLSLSHLNRIIDKIRKVRGVISVLRTSRRTSAD